jgi:hypothetical protein
LSEFLVSLRSYVDVKPMATLFARVVGIERCVYDNVNYLYQDAVTQQYYLYTYGLIYPGGESKSLSIDEAATLLRTLAPWKPMDIMALSDIHLAVEFVERDVLHAAVVECFVQIRLDKQTELKTAFTNRSFSQEGLFSLEEYSTTVKNPAIPVDTMLQGFFSALLFDENSYEIT